MIEQISRIPNVSLVFAVDQNNVLGKDNTIPWRSPHDFTWFKDLTLKGSTIMGRKTWESLPKKPLPGRTNYVVTTNPAYTAEGAIVVTSLAAAINHSLEEDKNRSIFVIGGRGLLEEASRLAGRAYISRIGVRTPVEGNCVLGPVLPPYSLMKQYQLNKNSDHGPIVHVDVAVFKPS